MGKRESSKEEICQSRNDQCRLSIQREFTGGSIAGPLCGLRAERAPVDRDSTGPFRQRECLSASATDGLSLTVVLLELPTGLTT